MWTAKYQENFKLLKQKFSTRPILAPFKLEHMTVVETDSSGYNMMKRDGCTHVHTILKGTHQLNTTTKFMIKNYWLLYSVWKHGMQNSSQWKSLKLSLIIKTWNISLCQGS